MKIAVLGAGTWGTTLAQVLVDNQQQVLLYARDQQVVDDINEHHQNNKYFNNVKLTESLLATSHLSKAMEGARVVILAVPTTAMRSLLEQIEPLIKDRVYLVNASKGFDPTSSLRISSLIREMIPENKRHEVVSIIGPGHAEEAILRQPTSICSVSIDLQAATAIQYLFSNAYFRVYTLTDEIGAEYAVALKNVIAVASGILSGLGLGDNARAALMTRGLAEMVRYGTSKGGQLETYLGLTGIGDLIVTCSSHHSRNFQAGFQIGKDDGVALFFKQNKQTVEGIRSCQVIYEDALKHGISMPIVDAVYSVLYDNVKPSSIIKSLMERPLKPEM